MIDTLPTPLILAFIDGLGFRTIDFESMPFLKTLSENSSFGELESILGYSSAVQASLVTGTYPRDHGLWFHYVFAPSSSPYRLASRLSLDRYWRKCPSRIVMGERYLIRRIQTHQFAKRYKGYWGFTMPSCLPAEHLAFFDIAETSMLYDRDCLKRPTIFDLLSFHHEKFVYVLDTPTRKRIPKDMIDVKNKLYYLHFSVDEANHYFGAHHAETKKTMKWVDEALRRHFQSIEKIHGKSRFVVFSDHGHSMVKHRIDLESEVKDVIEGHRIVAFFDATMARFWCPFGGKEELEQRLRGIEQGFLLTEEMKRGYGVDFPDSRYGEIIFVGKNGILFEPNSWGSQLEPTRYVSTHGYDPLNDESSGIFITDLTQSKKLRAIDLMPLAKSFLEL